MLIEVEADTSHGMWGYACTRVAQACKFGVDLSTTPKVQLLIFALETSKMPDVQSRFATESHNFQSFKRSILKNLSFWVTEGHLCSSHGSVATFGKVMSLMYISNIFEKAVPIFRRFTKFSFPMSSN